MVRRLDELLLEISNKKLEMHRLRTQQSDPSDQFRISDRLTALREEIRELEEERKHLVMYLKRKVTVKSPFQSVYILTVT